MYMALINCPECGKQVSDSAIQCPNCGFGVDAYVKRQKDTINNKTKINNPKLLIRFISIVLVFVFIGCIILIVVIPNINDTTNTLYTSNSFSYSDSDYEQEYTEPLISKFSLDEAKRAAMSYCSRVMSIYREVSSAVYTGDYNIIDEDTVYLDFNMTINGKPQIKSISCQRRENGTWKASLYGYDVN